VELDGGANIEVFINEFSHTLVGVNLQLTLSVPWDWSACDIPADFSIGGSGSGGEGVAIGITLQTNGVNNGLQSLLNLQQGTNVTLTDNGNGTVTIDASGGGDDVATEFNINHIAATGNPYLIGDRVWYNGNVYQCIAQNDALLPTNALYWALLGPGFRLRQSPVDWNATSGDFQILNKPTIPAAQIQSDWTQANNAALDFIKNKPTIPAAQVNSDWNAVSGLAEILNKPTIPTLTSELTNDSGFITAGDIPPIPTLTSELTNDSGFITIGDVPPQVNADWNAVGGVAEILNKPTIPSAQGLQDVITTDPVLTADNTIDCGTNGFSFDNTSSFIVDASNKIQLKIGTAQTGIDANSVSLQKTTGTVQTQIAVDTVKAVIAANDSSSTDETSLTLFPNSARLKTPNVNDAVATVGQVLTLSNAATGQVEFTTISVGNGTVTSVGTAGLISGGPITTSGTITTAMTTNKLVGRYAAGTGIMQEVSVGSGLTLTGAGVLNNTATPTPTGYYGAWQDVTTQSAAVSNTGYAMKFGTIDFENQVRMVSDGSNLTRITFDNTGIYNLNFSVQIQNTDNAEHDVTIWLRKNGVDVLGSAGFVTVPKRRSVGAGLEGHTIAGWNYMLNPVGGDYFQIMWSTTQASAVTLQFYAAGSPPPSTASTLCIVTQQSGIMAGTGLTALNSLTGAVQTFATGTAGTDFAISSAGSTHTFNLPTASAANRGALSSADWTTFNGKLTGNSAITGATKTKITYDSKGLVTAGADLAASDLPTGIDAAKIGGGAVSNTEFSYLDGVSSAIQTQINGKQNSIGLTTVGTNLATLPNPSDVRYLRINADNTVSALTLAQLKTDLSVGTDISVVLGSNVTNVGTGFEDVTGLSFAVSANKTYKWRATISYAATAAITISSNGPTASLNNARFTTALAATTNAVSNQSGYDTGTNAAASGNGLSTADGIFRVTASGTWVIRFRCATAGLFTIRAGSVLEYSEVL
jgi:hypothetical protein